MIYDLDLNLGFGFRIFWIWYMINTHAVHKNKIKTPTYVLRQLICIQFEHRKYGILIWQASGYILGNGNGEWYVVFTIYNSNKLWKFWSRNRMYNILTRFIPSLIMWNPDIKLMYPDIVLVIPPHRNIPRASFNLLIHVMFLSFYNAPSTLKLEYVTGEPNFDL